MEALLGVGALLSGGVAVAGAGAQADAYGNQARQQKDIADYNTKVSEEQATDAIELGEKDVRQTGMTVDRIVGSQRVAYAGQGVDVNSGSAADVQRDTRATGYQDVVTIRNNAARQAWGYKVQAKNATMQGKLAVQASENMRTASLATAGVSGLNGILGAANHFSKMVAPRKKVVEDA